MNIPTVGEYLDNVRGGTSQFISGVPYVISIEGIGDIGLGGVQASGTVLVADPFGPTFQVDIGDLGAIAAFNDTDDGTIKRDDVEVIGVFGDEDNVVVTSGNLRVIEANKIGEGTVDEFFDGRPEVPIVQATGQALLFKI